jgi:hypothetical protein
MNGKGDAPRPLSVDADTFANNWDRIFKKQHLVEEYQKELASGMFWEWYPKLTGHWDNDKHAWAQHKLVQEAQQHGEYSHTPAADVCAYSGLLSTSSYNITGDLNANKNESNTPK